MKFDSHDLNEEVLIVAEIGNNHEGQIEIAKKLIEEASLSKVNAVKLQTFIPEKYVTSADKNRLKTLKKFQLSKEETIQLSDFAKKLGLIFFSTPFDIDSAVFLNDIQSIFKISSGDNNFFPLINKVFEFHKPTIISTGLADYDLLDELYKKWLSNYQFSPLSFLHCVTSYPVPDNQANLKRIIELKKRFPKAIIGYSDHTNGIEASCVATSLGAKIIEKHFTLDKNFSSFRDHQLSSDPKELKELVKSIRKIENLLKPIKNDQLNVEDDNRKGVRRSIAVKRDIVKNEKITEKDLIWLRPGNGFPPGQEFKVIGKKTKRLIKKGEIILPEMIF